MDIAGAIDTQPRCGPTDITGLGNHGIGGKHSVGCADAFYVFWGELSRPSGAERVCLTILYKMYTLDKELLKLHIREGCDR